MITVNRGGNAWQHFTRALVQKRADTKPPEPLSLSEWANKYAVLSKENAAQTGKFRSFAYQDGMMDAITDPAVTQVSVMKSARVGYTKILDHVVGYYLSHDPSPILVVQPRVEDAEDYSKTEIAPMLRDTPALKAIAGEAKAKDSNQTILKKTFSNGANLTLVGANSPGGFRRITCRIILFDEVDGYPSGGAGAEGDQIALGIKRSETFWNRKIVLGSTPTVKETSRIEKAFKNSDQRYYYVPCPHCGEYQVLEWGSPDSPYGIKWEKDEHGNGLPETAYYVCRHHGCVIQDSNKPGMIKQGEWRASQPFKGHAGFHIWAGYSLFPNAAWKHLVAEWLRVKDDPLMRQTFINLVLGEPYEDRGEKALSERKLLERCEVWAAEVPDGVVLLTAGIDTQGGRFEIEVVGWGRNEESWSIAYDVIEGDLETDEPWQRLDAYLKQIWRRADGRGFAIVAACIDSGGNHTQQVYNFARERLGRRIWAIKGESARGGKRSPVWPTKRLTSRSKSSFKPIIIGVNAAKDAVRLRLHIEPPKAGEPVPAYMHFPADRELNYFSQLLAERSVVKVSGGQRYRVWEEIPGRANEALDCRVYSYAALCGLIYMGLKMNALADNIVDNPDRLIAPAAQPEIKTNLRFPGAIIPELAEDKPKRKRMSQLLP
ncbi:phage terminase large subunit family protein [Xenorhabdus sp. XENO-10]|uniref:Phage terminase large subunit family protein n=1 Tax=Xenorhabdus yunnanensis TaxID=3025878 RepID=A0ABT5LM35_9GAMM|nr:phage terminase large subunit family protein [Xenorhabdus yunnanensis]MDC9591538.1 phage terminase large subunit family protein [Xenorhabdus yunnanensis]